MELGFGGLLNKVELLVARSKQYRSKGVQFSGFQCIFLLYATTEGGKTPQFTEV